MFTVNGQYTSRGWTEWTQGFSSARRFCSSMRPATTEFLEIGRDAHGLNLMAPHVTHIGVHDHGFNNVSTYGNLLRLMNEGRIPDERLGAAILRAGAEMLGRGAGGALDANCRRRRLHLFVQRSALAVRRHHPLAPGACAVGHQLGHVLMGENDRRISLLDRLIEHARATAQYSVYYGEGRDAYDVRGRVAHESIFNTNDGNYPLPEFAAGLLAVHHLDARAGVGDVRLRRATRVSRDACRTTNSRHSAARAMSSP